MVPPGGAFLWLEAMIKNPNIYLHTIIQVLTLDLGNRNFGNFGRIFYIFKELFIGGASIALPRCALLTRCQRNSPDPP
jgi:hypothetical protein